MSENQHFIETYKSLITLSVEGFKFCALANGGAAVALLAYLGNISGKGSITPPDMRCAMGAFLSGLVACGTAMFFAYLTQLRLLNENANRTNGNFAHTWPLYMSMFFMVFSVGSFAFGSWQAVVSFR